MNVILIKHSFHSLTDLSDYVSGSALSYSPVNIRIISVYITWQVSSITVVHDHVVVCFSLEAVYQFNHIWIIYLIKSIQLSFQKSCCFLILHWASRDYLHCICLIGFQIFASVDFAKSTLAQKLLDFQVSCDLVYISVIFWILCVHFY